MDLLVKSILGMDSGPLVSISLSGVEAMQLKPEQARKVALILFSAAEAAEQDGITFRYFTENLGISVDEAVQLIGRLRLLREPDREEPGS